MTRLHHSLQVAIADRVRTVACLLLAASAVLVSSATATGSVIASMAQSSTNGPYAARVAAAAAGSYQIRHLPAVISRSMAERTYIARAWAKATRGTAGKRLVLTIREYNARTEVGHAFGAVRLSSSRYHLVRVRYTARRTGDQIAMYVSRRRGKHGLFYLGALTLTVTKSSAAPHTHQPLAGNGSPTPRAPTLPAPTHSSGPSSPQACQASFGTFSSNNEPPACWRPYGPNSPLNTTLPAAPRVSSNSNAIIHDLVQNNIHFEDGPNKFAVVTPGRSPVYWASPSDPLVTIHCIAYWGPGTCGDNGANIDGLAIHIPAGAQPEQGTDSRMTVVDQAAHVEYDFEHATWSSDHSTLTVYSSGTLPIGTDSATGLNFGTTAAGFGNLAGVIQPPELLAGQINHALSVSVPCTSGYVWPAAGPWGYDCSKMGQDNVGGPGLVAPPLGALLQLNMSDAEIASTGAPAWQRAIMTAMAHYGIYINDTSGTGDPHSIETEVTSDETYTSFGHPAAMANALRQLGASYYAPLDRWILAGLPIDTSRLRVIDPCVKQGTCS